MRYQIKYGPETLDESDDWQDACDRAEYQLQTQVVTVYVYDTEEQTRWDAEDWREDTNPGWNDHLEIGA